MQARFSRRFGAWFAAAALFCLTALGATGPAAHAAVARPPGLTASAPPPGASGPDLATRATAIADEVVARYALLQLPGGRFPDPIHGVGGDYGTAMLGYAMVRRGAERGDKALVRGGLEALTAQVDQPVGGAFELLALSRAYRWASGALPGDDVAAPFWAVSGPHLAADLAARGKIASQSGGAKCYADSRCYNNLKLVSSLASVELRATGLKPASPASLLADAGLLGRVMHRVNSRVPREAGISVARHGALPVTGGGLLSDPPRDPLAYHALSTMMLGELLEALGKDAPVAGQAAFERSCRALLALAAPDGDLTFYGRGQGQVWVPAAVASAAAQAAEHADTPELRGRYLALAEASLTRLRTVYGVGVNGLPLVPGAIDGPTLALRDVDSYATTRGYNGLAVDSLDRAAATLKRVQGTATVVPSATPGVSSSPSQAGVATLTRGGLWAAVAATSRAPEDARYGSGLLAMQRRDAAGRWSPIVPGRPDNPRRVNTLVAKSGGQILALNGTIRAANAAGVTVQGGFSDVGSTALPVDRGMTWNWSMPEPSTLTLRFRAPRDRVIAANALVGDGAHMRKVPFGFVITSPDGSAVQYSLGVAERRLPLARKLRDAGASAYDAHLGLAQAEAFVRRHEHVTLKIRVIAAAPTPATGG